MKKVVGLALLGLLVMCIVAAALASFQKPAEFTKELVQVGSEHLVLAIVGLLLATLVAALLGDESTRKAIAGIVGTLLRTEAPLHMAAALVLVVVVVAVVISAAGKALVSDIGATETPLAVGIAGQRSPEDAVKQFYRIVWGEFPELRKPFQTLNDAQYERLLDRVVGDPLTQEELGAVLVHPAIITPTTIITNSRGLLDGIRIARQYSVDVAGDMYVQEHWETGVDSGLVILQVVLPHRTVHNGGAIDLPAGSVYFVVRRVECDTCGGQGWHHFVVTALIMI